MGEILPAHARAVAALNPAEFAVIVDQRVNDLRRVLASHGPAVFWRADVPELRKQLLIIITRLAELHRLAGAREAAALRGLLDTDVAAYGRDLDAATDYADQLERALIEFGTVEYVHTLLASEVAEIGRPSELPWKTFLGVDERKTLHEAFERGNVKAGDPVHLRAVERLTFVTAKRDHIQHRHSRAQLQVKANMLRTLKITLAVLLAGLFGLIYSVEAARLPLALGAAAAGALGSALTGFFKVRDELNRIGALRLFQGAMGVQPFVGAAAGLVLYLALSIGLPGLTAETDLLNFAFYGFLAGFSEPFFLGVVSRAASVGGKDASGPVSPAAPKP